MLNLKEQFQNRLGFSLIELVLVIGISSILLLVIGSLQYVTVKGYEYIEEKDEIYLYGRYINDYINNEIRKADLIIDSEKIDGLNTKFPANIGFVTMYDRGENIGSNELRYNFRTYYMNGTTLVRIACNNNHGRYPKANDLKGYNEIYEKVISIEDTKIDYENRLVELSFVLGNDEKDISTFKSVIYLSNKIDY